MKACIYQKQDAVNIPLIETNILDSVLSLPWGVEVYLLLTKWNPFNFAAYLPKVDSGYNVLVTGLGPAGFALSHYLLNEGHRVTAIDGLKISPLHFKLDQPIKYWQDYKTPLSEKSPTGFGGVAEYGITNRWDKNNLTLVRLVLQRRESFNMYGGIRLGGNLSALQAFDLGFDHIALCLGAGRPSFLSKKSYFAKGVRSAADFLMNLQQGGAYLPGSNSNLLIRLPVVVVGCGLTAIDSAVEILHYYPVLVEKFLAKYEKNPAIENDWQDEDRQIALEFIQHAKLFRACSNASEKLKVINGLGGVSICYRKDIKSSPAYRLNPEEIEHAIAMGIKFESNLAPKEILLDNSNYASAVLFENNKIIPAKNVLIAIGTENHEFVDINIAGSAVGSFILGDNISHFGDCNQKYAGNVVKALASAKDGYRQVTRDLLKKPPLYQDSFKRFKKLLDARLISTIKEINILTDNIVQVVVHSLYAANNFKPGQFFRLQNFSYEGKKMMEPLALTGAGVDLEQGLISLIVLEMGKSSKLCRQLQIGEQIILMGPTGQPTNIASGKKVCLIGGGLGNAVLLPIAKALKENNCQVIYFAGYKKIKDRFCQEQIEANSDTVVWCCDEQTIEQKRAQDFSIKGNMLEVVQAFQNHFGAFDQVICIGSDRMMAAVSSSKEQLFGTAEMICSINSPMQCMMKGICGQCIQKVDDARGYIFTCACQDQNVDIVDFQVLSDRLRQNALLEKS